MKARIERLLGISPPATASAAVMLGLLSAVPGTAAASGSDGVLEQAAMKVSLGDLDLTTDRGLQLASGRIRQAARRLCERFVSLRDLGHHEAFLLCVDQAVARASDDLSALAHRAAESASASVPASRHTGR